MFIKTAFTKKGYLTFETASFCSEKIIKSLSHLNLYSKSDIP